MNSDLTIHCLRRSELDIAAWDRCIDKASNGLIYAYSWYLDALADQWDGLVLGDYEAVMPLPWRKKAGIYYAYQPSLTAQLGVFGNQLSEQLLKNFLEAIPARFRLLEFSLNHKNLFVLPHLYLRKNFVLDLSSSYEKIAGQYRENTRRNIKKSGQYKCSPVKDLPISQVVELARLQPGADDAGLDRFVALYEKQKKTGQAETYGVLSDKGALLASCVFLYSHGRAYYILVGNHPNGRTLGASHALIDNFIRDHAGQELLLDFEGSDLRNLAFFYSGFGAKEEGYTAIHLNRLPWYLRWIKKN